MQEPPRWLTPSGRFQFTMIVGHVGVALAARARAPKASLAWLMAATFAPDIWRGILSAQGYRLVPAMLLSHVLPWSAGLVAMTGAMAWLVRREGRTALLVSALVASHIALDMLSGSKPLWIGGPVGLDLQHMELLELLLEGTLLWAGWRMLPRARTSRVLTHPAFFLLLLAGQAAYLANAYLHRPPASRCLSAPFAPCWRKL